MYPQRSVMTCGLATALEPPHFNHAPVRGATPAPDLRIRGRVVSIHAPAWGATWSGGSSPRQTYCFNPRTRVGCDYLGSPKRGSNRRVSIHAPAWGATAGLIQPRRSPEVSIHAPAWGATFRVEYLCLPHVLFQSTHPRGVRREDEQALSTAMLGVSIHAPAWGATRSPHGTSKPW